MELKRPLPPDRSLKQLRHHYLVEKEIAERLKTANREQRKTIYATMYDELFRQVPDHPRLSRRDDAAATARANRVKHILVDRFLDESKVFLEFAPGDCRFVTEISKSVKYAYGLDISDQRRQGENNPANFQLVTYDGYSLSEIESSSIDVIFSDQLIEHIHPDDTKLHFALAHRLLKPKGLYVFRTPHFLTGPHDISMYFSDFPECFHLKEWTYREIRELLLNVGYARFRPYWNRWGVSIRMPNLYFASVEIMLQPFPKRHIKRIAAYLLSQVYGVANK